MKCYQWKKTAIECSLDQIIRTDLPMLVITTDEEIKADPHLDQMLKGKSKKQVLCRKPHQIYFRSSERSQDNASKTY